MTKNDTCKQITKKTNWIYSRAAEWICVREEKKQKTIQQQKQTRTMADTKIVEPKCVKFVKQNQRRSYTQSSIQ